MQIGPYLARKFKYFSMEKFANATFFNILIHCDKRINFGGKFKYFSTTVNFSTFFGGATNKMELFYANETIFLDLIQCVKSFLKIFSLISKFFAHYKKNVFRTKVCSTVHVACFHSIFQRPFERPEKNLLSKFVLSNSRKTWLTLGKQGFSRGFGEISPLLQILSFACWVKWIAQQTHDFHSLKSEG